jgi:hypothetical protein
MVPVKMAITTDTTHTVVGMATNPKRTSKSLCAGKEMGGDQGLKH